jgi:hypothetical protein
MGLVKGIIIDSKTGEPIKNVKVKVITNASLYNISPLKIVNKLKKVNIKSIPFTNKKEKSWIITIPILKENNFILNIVISNSLNINPRQVIIKTENITDTQNQYKAFENTVEATLDAIIPFVIRKYDNI